MDNQTTQEQKVWEISGRRYFGRTKTEIPTEITMNGQSVHVKIKRKVKRDFEFQEVDGKREMVPIEKEINTEEHDFMRTDVRSIGERGKFLWYPVDYVMLVISVIVAFFTAGLFLLASAAYILFFVRCNHLVITLNSGKEIQIPLSYLITKREDVEDLKNNIRAV